MPVFEQHCDACQLPGASSDNREEVQTLANLHNHMLHRGEEASTVRRLPTRRSR